MLRLNPDLIAEIHAASPRPTCEVTMFHLAPRYLGRGSIPLCGQPVVAHGLCEKHYADRIRLGGAA